LVTTIFN